MRPPLLLVHGAFGQAANFEPWLSYFKDEGYAGVAISLPGHAPRDAAALRRLTFAGCLAAIRDRAAKFDRPPVVVGHSLGGLLGLMFAAEGNCAGVVTVAAPAPGRLPMRANAFGYVVPQLWRLLAGLPVTPSPEAVRALVTHGLSPAEADEVVAQAGMESGRVLRRLAVCATGVSFDAIRCPVLCLSAGGDRVVPASAGYRIAAATNAEHIVFPEHGHWLIAGSLTGTVAAEVCDWLARRL